MSVDYYMACEHCHVALHVAQDGLGGFTFYSGMPECMTALGTFLREHSTCAGYIRFLPESIVDEGDFLLYDTSGNLVPHQND